MVSLGWYIAINVLFLTIFCNLVKKKEGVKVTKGFHLFLRKNGPMSPHYEEKNLKFVVFKKYVLTSCKIIVGIFFCFLLSPLTSN
jgi:radical SAM superfamily enzyme